MTGYETPKVALISVAGTYATAEALKSVNKGINAFIFSDNVAIEDEVELKQLGVKNNVLVMGPDCGTALIDGIPLGFVNQLSFGSIGLVGAAGTGLQEVSCLIDQLGEGITEIIGVGGRDLSKDVKGLMTIQGIKRLVEDVQTQLILVVSKPPAPEIANLVVEYANSVKNKKRVIFCFIGEPSNIDKGIVGTLEEGALLAVSIQKKQPLTEMYNKIRNSAQILECLPEFGGKISGLFSGGTFTHEAKLLFKELKSKNPEYSQLEYEVIDLGDDQFTVGVPHPMIDFSTRNKFIIEQAKKGDISIFLLDIVLGHGANENPAEAIKPAIEQANKINKNLTFVAHICGTNSDPQSLRKQQEILKTLGVILVATSKQAIEVAAKLAIHKKGAQVKVNVDYYNIFKENPAKFEGKKESSAINIGLKAFESAIIASGNKAISVSWKPPADGDRKTGLILAELYDTKEIGKTVEEANVKVLDILKKAEPILVGVDIASAVIPFFSGSKKRLLHAGPPISWARMCGPMKGAVIGAILYENWATNEQEAWELANSGEIEFSPCNEHHAVSPMAGLISPSFPVFIVKNSSGDNYSFTSFNEGLGKVLRFGAYDNSVLERLAWIKSVIFPAFYQVLRNHQISLGEITSKALQMGDECHNRNAAASSLFFKEVAIEILKIENLSTEKMREILQFLHNNNHFFLNLSMAACKVALDAAHGVPGSTVVTTIARNGVDFGIKLSGSNLWFTAPSPIVNGLFFPSFSAADANPDLGDSSITEAFGIGASAMAASPAIVGFVGGDASSALHVTKEMYSISLGFNSKYPIASLDFKGTPLAFDAKKICDTGITPVINTGIAHMNAGIGQIGAGICRAPLSPFQAALNDVYNTLPNKTFYFTKRSFSTSTVNNLRPFITFISRLPK